MRKDLYQLIEKNLQEIEEIKHVGLWSHQVNAPGAVEFFSYPAVFIEFTPIEWSLLGNSVRQADAIIQLHVVSEGQGGNWSEMSSIFSVIDKITKKLHRISKKLGEENLNEISSLVCISSTTDNAFGNLMHNIEIYKCYIKDFIFVPKMEQINGLQATITH